MVPMRIKCCWSITVIIRDDDNDDDDAERIVQAKMCSSIQSDEAEWMLIC